MADLLFRFVVGGAFVSLFASLGDTLRPKSFAGLLGAAPSIALATVALTLHKEGKSWTALEGRSMLFGAAGFFVYAVLAVLVLRRHNLSALATSAILMPVWFAVSLGLWAIFGGIF